MLNKYVGWMRFGWSHWEPLITGDTAEELWEQLRERITEDPDGERLVLPSEETPILSQSLPESQ